MDPVKQLEYMLVMAAVDGSLNMSEMKLLRERCEHWGIDKADFSSAMNRALSPETAPKLPTDRESGLQLLANLGEMMAADGRLFEVERGLYEATAQRLGIAEEDWPLPGTARARFIAKGSDKAWDPSARRSADAAGRAQATDTQSGPEEAVSEAPVEDSTELPELRDEDFDLGD